MIRYVMEPVADRPQGMSLTLNFFIMAANCDERAYVTIDRLKKTKTYIEEIVVLDYLDFRPGEGTEAFEQYMSYKKHIKNLKSSEILCNDDNLSLSTLGINKESQIGLDITGFSIPDLFRILYVLKEVFEIKKIQTFYTEPLYYSFATSGLFDAYDYLLGPREYKAIDEFYSSGRGSKEVLALFLGFDRMTSTVVREAVDPSDIIVINGFPSTSPKLKDISLLNNYELVSKLDSSHIFSVRANCPFDAFNRLKEIRKKYPNQLINICVLGSKPMALGSAMFALMRPENVKVSYAHTKEHSFGLAIGYRTTWHYSIELSKDGAA